MNWKTFLEKARKELERLLARFEKPTPTPEPEPEPEPVDPTPTPEPEPTPEPTPGPVDGTILPSQVQWLSGRGFDYKNASVVLQISSASMSSTHLNFKTATPIPWPKRGEKNVDAVGFLIRKIGTQFVGGKCEWCVSARGWYDIKTNTIDGYNGHTTPAKGETCWAGLGNPDNGKDCSTLVPFLWAG